MDKVKDLETIKAVFDKYNVKLYIVYGALLGLHRDGKLIEHDDDIDLAIIDPIDLKTRKAIGWALFNLGFKPQPISFNVFGVMEPSEPAYNGDEKTGIIVCERNFKFTIFFFKEEVCDMHGTEYVCTPKLGAMKLISIPKRFFMKPGAVKLNGKKYLTPEIVPFLEYAYINWKDKNGRDHSPTYSEAHAKESLSYHDANSVTIWK